jgi:hypothetical protein
MKRSGLYWLAVLGILTGASGCDNVTFGGIDIRLEGPPEPLRDSSALADDPDAPPPIVVPSGPILFAGERSGSDVRLVAIALEEDGVWVPAPGGGDDPALMSAFLAERLVPGSRYTLFSRGVRVGTAIQTDSAVAAFGACGVTPTLEATAELVPSAVGATRFLAMAEQDLDSRPYRPYQEIESTYTQRSGSIQAANTAIVTVDAPWPPSVLETRRDFQIRTLDGVEEPALVGTFLYQDQLSVGPAEENAYSIFYTAFLRPGGVYRPDYLWFRPYGEAGKAAPRLHSNFDLDQDGKDELLLEVFGESERWYQLEGFRDGRWVTLFASPCALDPVPGQVRTGDPGR